MNILDIFFFTNMHFLCVLLISIPEPFLILYIQATFASPDWFYWYILVRLYFILFSVVHLLTKKKKLRLLCTNAVYKVEIFFLSPSERSFLSLSLFSVSHTCSYGTVAAFMIGIHIMCLNMYIDYSLNPYLSINSYITYTIVFASRIVQRQRYHCCCSLLIFFSHCSQVWESDFLYIWINRKLCIYQLPAYVYIYISKGIVLCPGTWLLYYYCKLLWCVWLHYVAWST